MGSFWSEAVIWFQGKKTILGGVIVMAAAVAGVWYGKVDAVTGATIFGAGLSIVGGSAKANRHQAELLEALQGVAAAGADVRAGKAAQALQVGEQTLKALEPGVLAAAAPTAASALHVSGATADDVIRMVTGLAIGQGLSYAPPRAADATVTVSAAPVSQTAGA